MLIRGQYSLLLELRLDGVIQKAQPKLLIAAMAKELAIWDIIGSILMNKIEVTLMNKKPLKHYE